GLGDTRIETFAGAGEPGRSADSPGWQELRTRNTPEGRFRSARFYVASAPVETRGLRWMTTGGVSQVQLGEISVFSLVTNTDLASRPPPRFWTVPRVSPGRIQVDGRDADWPAGRTNGFALAWDEQRLYLLYHATGAEAAFENRGTNVQELFHTGDALDLQLQTRHRLQPNR